MLGKKSIIKIQLYKDTEKINCAIEKHGALVRDKHAAQLFDLRFEVMI